MNSSIFKYIEYVLPEYNCVVIPDFGCFIANIEPARFAADGVLVAPSYQITFNPDLKHNDGVLLSYIQKDEHLSNNAALAKIKEAVKNIKIALSQDKLVQCGNLGELSMDANHTIIFKANSHIIHPNLVGLTQVQLEKLSDIARFAINENKKSKIKYLYGGVAAAVAAIFLFALPTTSVRNNDTANYQQAGFVQSLASQFVTSPTVAPIQEAANAEAKTVIDTKIEKEIAERSFYIIVCGEESKTRAENLLKKIQASDFPKASIVESPDRYRIYTARFDDRAEAETYLQQFKKENPTYETAWVYSQKNK